MSQPELLMMQLQSLLSVLPGGGALQVQPAGEAGSDRLLQDGWRGPCGNLRRRGRTHTSSTHALWVFSFKTVVSHLHRTGQPEQHRGQERTHQGGGPNNPGNLRVSHLVKDLKTGPDGIPATTRGPLTGPGGTPATTRGPLTGPDGTPAGPLTVGGGGDVPFY